jgi:CheY-like chemotaxis protein
MTAAPTILIVDDSGVNRRLIQALLEPQGYDTRTAASGEDALVCIAKDPPDLILPDVMMPGLDGRQVAKALKTDRRPPTSPSSW